MACTLLSPSWKILPMEEISPVFILLLQSATLVRPFASRDTFAILPAPNNMPSILTTAAAGSLTVSYVARAALPSSPAMAMTLATLAKPSPAATSVPTTGTNINTTPITSKMIFSIRFRSSSSSSSSSFSPSSLACFMLSTPCSSISTAGVYATAAASGSPPIQSPPMISILVACISALKANP
ncbi:hypothetical protein ASPVEDRAFT_330012 [Aspergillus versicolor CBS 583.65]|uniref:Uncharacterized protein n=1 Tax=Aspergillus versicolor CBS 583.65 TaxID=1036611 RepID=A0A1L9PYK1_ASPVE|nr:uncharacterized protein ASPVEDRAFT_330012 [Aspergillus versicolor CBS 583.65]OJJ06594.1 hypothetical protein ASPVEDRAFT_330012 [Aspergillus versicolor CBS 583.65]